MYYLAFRRLKVCPLFVGALELPPGRQAPRSRFSGRSFAPVPFPAPSDSFKFVWGPVPAFFPSPFPDHIGNRLIVDSSRTMNGGQTPETAPKNTTFALVRTSHLCHLVSREDVGVARSATPDLPAATSMCRLAMSATDSQTSPTFPSSVSPGSPIARKYSFAMKNAGKKF